MSGTRMSRRSAGRKKDKLLEWLKSEGEEVAGGDKLAVIEREFDAEKREHTLFSPVAGTLTQLISAGQKVGFGDRIAYIRRGNAQAVFVWSGSDSGATEHFVNVVFEPTNQAAEQAGGSAGQAADEASRTTEQAVGQAGETFEQVTDPIRQLAGQATDQAGRAEQETTWEEVAEDALGVNPKEVSPTSPAASRRLNVVFSQNAYDELKELADQSGKTISDVVRDAIALQKWFNDIQRGGGRILVEQRGRVREILSVR